MDDLVKRLRELADDQDWLAPDNTNDSDELREAADRIEALETKVKRLEQQLKMARRLAHRPKPEYPPEIGIPHLRED